MSRADAHSTGASLHRVLLIARQTLAEALRLRLTLLLGVTGTLLVLMALWLRQFNFGAAELMFIGDFGLGVISLLGTLLAALGMAHLYFSDISGGMVACVLTRTVRRGEYLTGKLVGVLALLALFVAALALVLGGLIAWREAQIGAAFVPLAVFLQACALGWLKLTLVAAMTLVVCTYASSALFAAMAGLLLTVVAHLRPLTEAEGWRALLRLWPNLGLFDVEPLFAGSGVTAPGLLLIAGYWFIYLVLLGWAAVYVFKHREF